MQQPQRRMGVSGLRKILSRPREANLKNGLDQGHVLVVAFLRVPSRLRGSKLLVNIYRLLTVLHEGGES
jgi:hypothetical protein